MRLLVVRPLAEDGHRGGAFAPIVRPRVVDRIASAATHRIVLIVAPAGYGKSVALMQYLDTVRGPKARYDVLGPQPSLSSFVRGFADALEALAPDVRRTVADACEVSRSSETPGIDLAMWMQGHLKNVHAIIALDDLHVADENSQIATFLQTLIASTRKSLSWVIASRSVPNLPIASWLAYGEMDGKIDDRDLCFTAEEARQTASAMAAPINGAQIDELLSLTDGWATALNIALRTSVRTADLHNIAATTREVIYRFLAEQAYASLTFEERDFLHWTCYLPEIDLQVLKQAGCAAAKSMCERLSDRTSLVFSHRPGVYRCHDLFRDFLQHQLELEGDEHTRVAKFHAAATLLASGQNAQALHLYADSKALEETLTLLESSGFELFDQGYGDEIQYAISVLPVDLRQNNAVIVGLGAAFLDEKGEYDKAESQFERAIALATNAELKACVAIRHARIGLNLQRSATPILESLYVDTLPVDIRAEMASLLAIGSALTKRLADALKFVEIVEKAERQIESIATRAKLLHRIGGAGMMLEMPCEQVYRWKRKSAALATEIGMPSWAARAFASLAIATFLYEENLDESDRLAMQGASLAKSVGSQFVLQTALGQMMFTEKLRGNSERLIEIAEQYAGIQLPDPVRTPLVIPARGFIAAWQGQITKAHQLLLSSINNLYYPWDRASDTAVCALLLVADGEREHGLSLLQSMKAIDEQSTTLIHGKRQFARAKIVSAAAYALAGRSTQAWKMLRLVQNLDTVTKPLHESVEMFSRALENRMLGAEAFMLLETATIGNGGVAKILEVVFSRRFSAKEEPGEGILTQAEIAVLQAVADGQSPKEIAAETGRSVHTVRTLCHRAAQKLLCSGRQQAIVEARKMGLVR